MSNNDLIKLIDGDKIKSIVKIKFNQAYIHQDIKLNGKNLQLLDKNNKLIEDFNIPELYPQDYTIKQVFDSSLSDYVTAVSQGFNVSILSIGSSSSEKNKIIDSNSNDDTIIQLFSDLLFSIMNKRIQEKKQNPRIRNYNYYMKIKCLQVLDETCNDLLSKHDEILKVEINEWDGPTAFPCSQYSFKNINELKEILLRAKSRKTREVSEFGSLIDKCFFLYQIELIQITEINDLDTPYLISSKVNFFEIPSIDPLSEDQEQVTHIQGSSLNRTLFAFKNIINNLAQNKNISFFGTSLGTQLLKESLTGNSYTISFHFLNYGELAISSQNLRLLSNMKYLSTFPVKNDGNLWGLLRIFRMESLRAFDLIKTKDNAKLDEMALNQLDLEKKLINENKEIIEDNLNKQKLSYKISDLREKYNELVKSKAEKQAELIKSEEEKLQLSKALVELQIENTKLLEMFQSEKFEGNNKLVEQEAEILARNVREEKALEVIKELQDKLENLLEEKKDLEIEFITIRKNFIIKKDELNFEKEKNEKLGIELINITNENKEYQKELLRFQRDYEDNHDNKNSIYRMNEKLKNEVEKNKEAILMLKSENERLKNEINKYELKEEQLRIELENKKIQMEKGYLDLAKEKDNELNNYNEKNRMKLLKENENKKFYESERLELLQQKKKLNRKINEYLDKINEMKKHLDHINKNNLDLNLQIDEMRSIYRTKLKQYESNLKDHGSLKENKNLISYNAREDLLRSYEEKEVELMTKLENEKKYKQKLQVEVNSLKSWSRQLKYIAEDNLPPNAPIPEVLQKNFNNLGDLKLNKTKHFLLENDEYEVLRNRNKKLEENLKKLNDYVIGLEKNDIKTHNLNRPMFEDLNPYLENLQKENENLKKENESLHNSWKENNKHEVIWLQKENIKLKKIISELENRNYSTSPIGNDHKILIQKLNFYEKNVKELEIQRTQLLSRCTMAEERLKSYEDLLKKTSKEYQKKINELKKNIN